MAGEFATNILRASFQGIAFPVSEADTVTSHDGQAHKAYRVPGADWEPTGLNEEKGTLVVPLFNGVEGFEDLYPGTHRALLDAIRQNPIGDFVHPTRGPMRAFLSNVKESAKGDVQDGVVLVLTWAEHTGLVASRATDPTRTQVTRSSVAVVDLSAVADTQMLLVDPLASTTLTLGTALLMAEYFASVFASLDAGQLSFGAISSAFALMANRVEYNRGLAVMLAASGYAAQAALANVSAALLNARTLYLPRSSDSSAFRVEAPMAVWDVALAVYGDASLVAPIYDANTLVSPFLSPGTVLTILPDPGLTASRLPGVRGT